MGKTYGGKKMVKKQGIVENLFEWVAYLFLMVWTWIIAIALSEVEEGVGIIAVLGAFFATGLAVKKILMGVLSIRAGLSTKKTKKSSEAEV